MTDNLSAALLEMSQARDLLIDIAQSVTLENTGTDPQAVKTVKAKMAAPEWRLKTHNLVEGVIAGDPVKLLADLEFLLDTKTLFKNMHDQKTPDPVVMNAALAQLKSRENGEALVAILMDSLLPHAYGTSSQINLTESIPHYKTLGLIEEIVGLKIDDGLVKINYAHVLSRFLPPAINLNQSLFESQVWVNAEFLRGSEPFSKDFYFEDDSNGQPLSVTLACTFTHL